MSKWDMWQYKKRPNFSKSKLRKVLGPTFFYSSHRFTSKTPFIVNAKMAFLPLLLQRPWLDLRFFAPALKNYATTSILIFYDV